MRDATREPYGRLERWLHWLALHPLVVREISFELERLYALPKRLPSTLIPAAHSSPADGAVYICGLARSGTTLLLQILDQLQCFRSLTYRDMPFVLAPNLWRLLNQFGQRHVELTERVHGDGVLVDFDSPESFEEVFWRTFGGTSPDPQEGLGAANVSSATMKAFADYRAMVANPRRESVPFGATPSRYLSKNNNNLLRLSALSSDPTATILLLYRDPIATSRSLHRLHLQFCTATRDNFTQRYMAWLGHHEFGPGHRPFAFARSRMNAALQPNDPNYWLDYWNAVYLHVLDLRDSRFNLISHDQMRHAPSQFLAAIFALLGVQGDISGMAAQIRIPATQDKPPTEFAPEILSAARETHRRLLVDASNILPSNTSS